MKFSKCEVTKIENDQYGPEYKGGTRIIAETLLRPGESAEVFHNTQRVMGTTREATTLIEQVFNLFRRPA